MNNDLFEQPSSRFDGIVGKGANCFPDDSEQELIVAERAHLSWVGSVVAGFVVILLCFFGLVFFLNLESFIGQIICIALIILFLILIIVDCVEASMNNRLPTIAIRFQRGRFWVDFGDNDVDSFLPSEIKKATGQSKKNYIFAGYFFTSYTSKYGKLRIWLRASCKNRKGTLIELDHILNPEAVATVILTFAYMK